MKLNLQPNIAQPDDFYEKLIALQKGLNEDEVQFMYSKLILILANHIGDVQVLNQAMEIVQPSQNCD